MSFSTSPIVLSHEHVSRVDAPCLLHGTIGLCIGILMQLSGLFEQPDAQLLSVMLKPVFQGEMPYVIPVLWLGVIGALFSYGLAFAILDTAGTLKRVMLGVTVLVLVLAIQPTLAVWHLYFSPFLPVVSVFWTWFFTMLYVNHHVMPCELGAFSEEDHTVMNSTELLAVSTEEKKEDEFKKYQPAPEQVVESVSRSTEKGEQNG